MRNATKKNNLRLIYNYIYIYIFFFFFFFFFFAAHCAKDSARIVATPM